MRDFELDRPVDAVRVMAKNPPRPEEITPQWLYVPFVAAAIAVLAYVYLGVVNQVAAGVGYYVAAGTEVYVS
uniref:Uncharacterized protein n=1 Tax=Ammonifex degensii TaxID=42838 RepID=A0A7C1J4Q1_9THEO